MNLSLPLLLVHWVNSSSSRSTWSTCPSILVILALDHGDILPISEHTSINKEGGSVQEAPIVSRNNATYIVYTLFSNQLQHQ